MLFRSNAQTWSLENKIDNGSDVHCLSFSRDGSLLATGSKDGLLHLWDVQTWTHKQDPIAGHEEAISCIAFSPNGIQIATGSSDKTVRLWNAGTGESIGTPMAGHEDDVRALAWSPDGSTLASGDNDEIIILWETGPSRMRVKLSGHKENATRDPLHPTGIISLAFMHFKDQEPSLLSLNQNSYILL